MPRPPQSLVAPAHPSHPSHRRSSAEVTDVRREVSEICGDLSALSDPGALEGALARVSTLLNATGLIVWIASNDSSSLSPVATHGFDPKMVARIGKIARDSSNLTAAAFRDNAPKSAPPTATAPGALAVPMCSPTGPAGVLSVELKPGQAVDEAKVALAAIIAAQLATLAMPIAGSPASRARPREAEAADSLTSESAIDPQSRSESDIAMNVILAEDDLDIQLVARLALKRAGFIVKVVGNGQEALDAVKAEPPDVILLDWMMPELDGPETCRRLKSDPATASIPVIFLTAKSQEAEIQRGLSLGASGYVTKPFDALTLGQHVKDIVSKTHP